MEISSPPNHTVPYILTSNGIETGKAEALYTIPCNAKKANLYTTASPSQAASNLYEALSKALEMP
jgi:hypothetical protein